jgi:signal transduction histidine kinase
MLYSGCSLRGSLDRDLRLSYPLFAYVLALLLPLVALGFSLILWRSTYPAVFLLFFGAVSVVACYGGFWPGLASAVESAALADYYLMIPGRAWSLDPHTIVRISIFLACSALISWLGERQRRTLLLLDRTNSTLAHEHERLKLALSAADAFAWGWSPAFAPTPTPEDDALRELKGVVLYRKCPGEVHPEDEPTFDRVLREQIKQPASFELEYRVVGPETRWLRTKGQAVTGSPGVSHSMVGITFDVTREKQSLETLRRSERLVSMGQLAATVAHEINNPLESITSLIHLAKSTCRTPLVQEYLDLILAEADRVADIARNTLGFCRDLRRIETVRVGDALNVILNLYRKKALKKHVQLITRWGEDLEFRGFAGELKQIVSNLVSNALEASSAGGTILVRARKSLRDARSGIIVTVADNGPGIALANREKVFQPFFTTKDGTGTGLGLWITREIVAQSGGDIRLKTYVKGEYRGTTFRVFLPTATEPTGIGNLQGISMPPSSLSVVPLGNSSITRPDSRASA